MPEPKPGYLKSRIEQGVLILTILEQHLRSDALADALRQEFIDVVDQTGLTKVIIDMGNVESLSSTGLRPMLGLHRHLQPKGGQLALCGLAPEVAKVFAVTRLVGMTRSPFQMAADVANALALFNPPPS